MKKTESDSLLGNTGIAKSGIGRGTPRHPAAPKQSPDILAETVELIEAVVVSGGRLLEGLFGRDQLTVPVQGRGGYGVQGAEEITDAGHLLAEPLARRFAPLNRLLPMLIPGGDVTGAKPLGKQVGLDIKHRIKPAGRLKLPRKRQQLEPAGAP